MATPLHYTFDIFTKRAVRKDLAIFDFQPGTQAKTPAPAGTEDTKKWMCAGRTPALVDFFGFLSNGCK